ncbi:MAG: phosphate--AMP phosphotransferase, partial [Ruminiclostridium sp.]|nr:phosphate--AMP phosphotransferase [Ruminiclostridium sp.]
MLDRIIQREIFIDDKDTYKAQAETLKVRMRKLEQEIKEKKLPVIIAFEGWGASGKGYVISKTINCLDPRSYKVYSTVKPTESEKRMPLMHRFWNNIPEKGKLCILD